MKTTIICILFFQLFSVSIFSQDWLVPADKGSRLSPFAFTDSINNAGMQMYNSNCLSCHGTPGKGNVQPMVPPPPDPATEKIQRNRDGEMLYKIAEGRGQMPSFKNVLSTQDIWNIIAYIRSFNSTYTQTIMPVITSRAYPGAVINMSLQLNTTKDSITLKVLAIKNTSAMPVKDAGIKLFVKRTFGLMPVDEEKITDNDGFATFAIPSGLPGDTAGYLMILARFSDEEQFGTSGKDTLLHAGVKVVPVSLIKQRAMWNVVRKAPIWILLTYSLGVIAVWSFIFYVLFKLRDIYIIGKYIDQKKTRT